MRAHILVVEDNELNRYLITFMLEKTGHRVSQAVDGQQGIAMAALEQPDLILLDIQLPGMDGYTVARTLKADPATAAVPIVAVTSYAMVGDRERALEAGCVGYIEKPINPDTFVDEVRRYLPA
jgi:two-component system cell cycle response regulator DivK